MTKPLLNDDGVTLAACRLELKSHYSVLVCCREQPSKLASVRGEGCGFNVRFVVRREFAFAFICYGAVM